ncbi:MAG: hypothetical protein M3Y13_07020, partial [Armatimonadota bacterium]|nr:hypothetical protein [Armatimonadota bacterium]
MKNTLTRLVIPALAGLALTSTAFAQAPGGGGFGGGGGRGGGRAPFALGPISAIDAAAGTITITPQFGGQGPQILKIGPDTQLVTQSDATVADLKVGDQVQITGMPTGITATQIMTGQGPAFMQRGGRGGGNGG